MKRLLLTFVLNLSFLYSFSQIANPVSDISVCDDGVPDGITFFDLTVAEVQVLGDQNPNDFAITYYQTQSDAINETNAIASPWSYANLENPQTIYIRLEELATGNFDTTSFNIVVVQVPVANSPQPLRYCDPDNDGFGVFSLTDADSEITGGTPGLTVTYYETLSNANNNIDAIDTTSSYANIMADLQTLFARVENDTSCATVEELQLIVEPTPQIVVPSALEECDDLSADGFANFDLTIKESEILNGLNPLQYAISYYESIAEAGISINPISNPSGYINTSVFNQTIWVRVEDTNTLLGCYQLTSLELIVNPLPELNQPMPLELCDINNPGDEQESFFLEDASSEILNGQVGITLTFYETLSDADNATNAISSPYVNTSSAQTIYVRGENDITSCYSTTTLILRVNPLPTPTPSNQIPDLDLCDEVNSGDGIELFDLTENEVLILNGEVGTTATYYETAADAVTGENAIADPSNYTNMGSPEQDIYVRVTGDIAGCYAIVNFTIRINPLPQVNIGNVIFCQSSSAVADTGLDGTNYAFTWSLNGSVIPNETQSSLNITQSGNYTVEALDIITSCSTISMFDAGFVDCGTDTDSDNVSNSDEDINGNGNLEDDDTDMDGIPNYLDDDDDGDGVLTIDEDYNNNGDPTDDDTNTNSIPDYLESSIALSINDFEAINFRMFPNPANGSVTIQLNNNPAGIDYKLDVIDIQGKLLQSERINRTSTIDVSSLSAGVYFVRLSNGSISSTEKLIVD